MSLLQRPPIDVHASVGCTRAPEHLYRSTLTLLTAGQTLRPYAGALIKSALTKTERALVSEANDGGHPPFLEHINRAVRQWWPTFRSSPDVFPLDLTLDDFSDDDAFEGHFDQGIRRDGLPHEGPITAIAVVEGSVKYSLTVSRKNVFDPNNTDFFNEDGTVPDGHTHEVTGHTGDVLLFTNIPAVYHSGISLGPSLRAIYHSHLGRNPVE